MSIAVRVTAVGIESVHSIITSAGNASTKLGAVVSSTVMVCVCVVVNPQASVAVHVLANE